MTDEDGTKKQIQEKVVVYWSRAFYAREYHQNQSFIEFIQKLKANPNGFRITAAQSRSIKKFLKKGLRNKETGEVLDGRKLLTMTDEEKLTEYNDLMGYYQIVSSELLPDDYYRLLNAESEDLKTILQAFGMSIPYKLFSRGNLRTLKPQRRSSDVGAKNYAQKCPKPLPGLGLRVL